MQRSLALVIVLVLALLAFGCTSQPVPSPVPTAVSRVTAVSSTPAPLAASSSSTLSPLAATASPTALSGALDGTRSIGRNNVTLFSSPNPPVRGSNMLEAIVTDASGNLVKDLAVSFDLDMTNMSHGKNVVQAALGANGRYSGRVSFVMPGPWRVIVSITPAGGQAETGRFTFNVSR